MSDSHNPKMRASVRPKDVLPLFPIAIGCYAYPDREYISGLKEKVRDYVKDLPHNRNWDNEGLKHYMQRGDLVDNAGNTAGVTLNNTFFKHFECPELYDWFCECAFQFHTEVLGLQIQSKYLITDSWVNCNTGEGGQSYHAHVNSFLSGTFYLDSDESAAPIEFQSPKYNFAIEPHMGFTPDTNNASIFSQPRAAVKPMEGDLLLWESHVRHGYSENHSPNRMSLSINMIPRIVFSHRYGFVVKPLEEELNGITTEAAKKLNTQGQPNIDSGIGHTQELPKQNKQSDTGWKGGQQKKSFWQ
tara:strand:+ start:4844 stop:5746 length:903 start_codon:yes stop_codon:yes gene_type:complete